ncbi:MAG: hypothetical protein ABJ056_08800 [Halioglobus sp.]
MKSLNGFGRKVAVWLGAASISFSALSTFSSANAHAQSGLTFFPDPLDIGEIAVGTFDNVSFEVINSTPTDITINTLSVIGIAGDVWVAGPDCERTGFNTVVPSMSNCTLFISIGPTILGPATGSIRVESDAPSSPDSLTVLVTGMELHMACDNIYDMDELYRSMGIQVSEEQGMAVETCLGYIQQVNDLVD